MAIKTVTQPVTLRRFYNDSLLQYVADLGEPLIDARGDVYKLRIGDGVTGGGVEVGGGNLGEMDAGVATPKILSPSTNTEVSLQPIFMASPFNAIKNGNEADTHVASYWEIATDAEFTNKVYESGRTEEYLTELDLVAAGVTLTKGLHGVRVCYVGTAGVASYWSSAVEFTTSSFLPDTQNAKLLASDGSMADVFGRAVAISEEGSTAVIGARYDDSGRGSVYVFTRATNGTWSQQQKLTASVRVQNSSFGNHVAISKDSHSVLVGVPGDDHGGIKSGSAYVFTRSGGVWTESAKLTPNDGVASDQFGNYVLLSADGGTALIGAHWDDDKGSNSGSVYVFTRNANGTWSQTAKLTASDGEANDNLGQSLALSADGGTAIIGAGGDDTGRGSAYVFTRSGGVWTESAKLLASDRGTYQKFGQAVALSGDGSVALIGYPSDNDKGSNSGSVCVFTRSGGVWTESVKLLASDGVGGDQFGYSVSLSGDGNTALVGAYYDDDRGSNSGSVYVFTRTTNGTWSQSAKLLASDGGTDDYFGQAVAISGDGKTAVIGAYGDDDFGGESGSAYIFA